MRLNLIIIFCLINLPFAGAQTTTFPANGPEDNRDAPYAFTHATIAVDYQTIFYDATLIIHKGVIDYVGRSLPVLPANAILINCAGRFIYPSFIESYSGYGMPATMPRNNNGIPQFISNKKGAYNWNEAIKPETEAHKLFSADDDKAKEFRANGFGAVCAHVQDGIARGASVLVSTGKGRENELVITEECTANYSLSKGSSPQDYPSSIMGVIALLRQTYMDAHWYGQKRDKTEVNLSLEAWNNLQTLPQVMDVTYKTNAMRALKVSKEFNKTYIIKGSGDEYQWLDQLKNTGAAFIIPINFPKPYDVSDAYNTLSIPLSSMKHWELAPYNPARLEGAKIEFAFTTQGAANFADFNKNLKSAMEKGLSRTQALKSLTYTPAHLLNVYDKLGSLAKDKLANFIILNDTLFSSSAVILQNWVQGKMYIVNNDKQLATKGQYTLSVDNHIFSLKIEGRTGALQASVAEKDTTYYKADILVQDNLVTLTFPYPHDSAGSIYRLNGSLLNDALTGEGQSPKGQWVTWEARRTGDVKPPKAAAAAKKETPGSVIFPFMAYGTDSLPRPVNMIFKNATVWTNEQEGILTQADIWIKDGKIKAVGKNLTADGAKAVDCSGKHITSGIIDEHSHIAISQGVNEGTQSVTSEVRIGDVVNGEDINIYRQLSGGVTCSHLLHGSANTIGGQTQLIKLRWGLTPEEMKFQGWPGFIKFALGENVKQSNWGDNQVYRFPQTRMGVEQTLYDAFKRANEYDKKLTAWHGLPEKQKLNADEPRQDLKLDALVEILKGERFITCHSYVQSEINMLLHVADSMHFKMNTFTHILEGYKVADKMKAHGVYASTFADWWAYKHEVIEAIPYNAALLTQMGITTAVNSDDAEMGRRLNQEAAKSIKYGGLTQEQAWKLCTLNPAIMLHVSNRTGSLKPGKDADIVIWSDNPLSIYAKAEATYIDGACYYSMEKDRQLRQYITTERQRLISKMLQARQRGESTQTLQLSAEEGMLWGCDTDGVWVR